MSSCGRALRDDLAAVHAGARAHVDDVIGGEDRLAIVLDDEHRVAEIAKARLRLDEARVVARVEADATARRARRGRRRAPRRSASRGGCAAPRRDESVCALRSSVR